MTNNTTELDWKKEFDKRFHVSIYPEYFNNKEILTSCNDLAKQFIAEEKRKSYQDGLAQIIKNLNNL